MNQQHSEQVTIAARLLGMSESEALANSRSLPEIDAVHFWQPVRGGGSLIVSRDGSVLYANSSVTWDVHLEAFKSGRRTDPADCPPNV
jgi:hypothetical protein